ncbi:hypothetical protein C8R43DRAFT_1131831 [Mycena crocata]|nr:hypothetical protein C8R43DRAFT_1131831 [Mycena crocata]
MPPNAAKALRNVSLVGQNKTAVVVGATLGMGAAVARLLAKLGCSRVIIFGRNAARAKTVLKDLKKLAPKDRNIKVEFVKGDLSNCKGMQAAATSLQEAAGEASIDYLVMTRSGVPTGTVNDNGDGYLPLLSDTIFPSLPFAIQAVSRFALAYLLTTRGGLAPNATIVSVCNQGQSLDDLSIDDLSLRNRPARRSSVKAFMEGSQRDSTVLDAFHEELNLRFPQYRYFHLSPGLVSSEEFSVALFPGVLKVVAWVGMKLTGMTPDQSAVFPVYILTAPDAEGTLGPSRYFSRGLVPSQLGKSARDPRNRAAVWEKLLEMIGEIMNGS